MGEFFGKEEKVIEDEERELITDVNQLKLGYDHLLEKIKITKEQAYNTIVSFRHKLRGSGDNDDLGSIDLMRKRIRTHMANKIPLVRDFKPILNDIEDLDGSSEDYAEYLEKFIEDLCYVINCLIKIDTNQFNEIRRLKDFRGKQTVMPTEYMSQKEITDYNNKVEEWIKSYIERCKTGDGKKIRGMKGAIMGAYNQEKHKRPLIKILLLKYQEEQSIIELMDTLSEQEDIEQKLMK